MTNRFWMPALASMALLLSACGDSEEESEVAPEERPATASQATPRLPMRRLLLSPQRMSLIAATRQRCLRPLR